MYFNLDHLMKLYDLSITDIHKKTGLSRSTITSICQNKATRLDLDTIEKLCTLFNCEVKDILKRDQRNTVISTFKPPIVDLNEKQKELIAPYKLYNPIITFEDLRLLGFNLQSDELCNLQEAYELVAGCLHKTREWNNMEASIIYLCTFLKHNLEYSGYNYQVIILIKEMVPTLFLNEMYGNIEGRTFNIEKKGRKARFSVDPALLEGGYKEMLLTIFNSDLFSRMANILHGRNLNYDVIIKDWEIDINQASKPFVAINRYNSDTAEVELRINDRIQKLKEFIHSN